MVRGMILLPAHVGEVRAAEPEALLTAQRPGARAPP